MVKKDILSNWNLIHKEDGRLKNAAIILFAKEVLPNYPQCHLKSGRFRSINMLGDFMDNNDFYGNAFQILEEANYFW
jgi:ATP-dependent DNA helicase RecG